MGLLGLAAAGCTSAGTTPTPSGSPMATGAMGSACVPGSNLTQTAQTMHYLMVLNIGPTETMYTQAQVDAQHPTTGEVMISGQMTDMGSPGMSEPAMSSPGMSAAAMAAAMGSPAASGSEAMMASPSSMAMASGSAMPGSGVGASARHLEIHICSLADGSVVQDAQPTIRVVDQSSGGMTTQVPVAVMEGIGMGTADLHYGNNLDMPAGHAYTVTVTLNSDIATFNIHTP